VNKNLLISILKELNHFGTYSHLNEKQKKILMNLNIKSGNELLLYRGLSFDNWEDFYSKTKFDKKVAIRHYFNANCGVHWSLDYEIAKEFASWPGKELHMVVEALVHPEDVVIEFDRLPEDILHHLEWKNESEVIVDQNMHLKVVAIWDFTVSEDK
jgi:hypothetical protein